MNIGKAMRRLRKEADIKQNVLAKEIGISASALRAIESEKSIPKPSTMKRFCDVMEIPLGYLILKAICYNDVGNDLKDAVDVRDIIDLAIKRMERSKVRKLPWGLEELQRYTEELKSYDVTKGKVNHPAHYQKDGKECIDVMVEDFGKEAVIAFCKLNAFKYRWRAGKRKETLPRLTRLRRNGTIRKRRNYA